MPPCLMAYYCLLWHRSTGNASVLLALSSILHIQGFFCKCFTLHRKGNTSMPSTLVTLNICYTKCIPKGSNLTAGNVCVCLKNIGSIGYDTMKAPLTVNRKIVFVLT